MAPSVDSFVQQHDHTQVALLNEPCILVDSDDRALGSGSKKDVHLLTNINSEKQMLHRAFSVFIFNSNNEILVTQRSIYKILFPNHWTNACCSHPLHVEGYFFISLLLVVTPKTQMKIKSLTKKIFDNYPLFRTRCQTRKN
jgi:isopentenyl-diphosphate delta-isomerase type 1